MDFNKELEKEISAYHKTSEIDHYNNLLNLLQYCILRTPTYLAEDPKINNKGGIVIGKDNTIFFHIIEDTEGNQYIPVFTAQEEYEKMSHIDEASIYHLEFNHIIDIFSIENNLRGIAINPLGESIIIEKEILFDLNKSLGNIEK